MLLPWPLRRLQRTENVDVSQDSITQWLTTDGPLQSALGDILNRLPAARRFSKKVLDPNTHRISVIGKKGAGKSSLINLALAQNDLAKQRVVCRVGLWGVSSQSISAVVLDRAIQILKDEVECSSVIRLPQSYATAVGAVDHWATKAVSTLLTGQLGPDRELRRLDRLCIAAGVRLLIIVEDLERNTWEHGRQAGDLKSLLDRMGELRNIQIVLAIEPADELDDALLRVCDHIETLPALGTTGVEVLIKLRGYLLDSPPNELIEVETRETMDKRAGLFVGDPLYVKAFGLEPHGIYSAVAQLVQTPRVLHRVAQSTKDTWERLRGEINLDDLIVLTCLLEVAPNVYGLVLERTRDFLSKPDPIEKRPRTLPDAVQRELAARVVKDGVSLPDVARLLNFAFGTEFQGFVPDGSWETSLQGVGVQFPVDYFARLQEGEILDDRVSDQNLLRALVKAKNGELAAITDLFRANRDYFRLTEHIGKGLLNPKLVRRIVEAVILEEVSAHGADLRKEEIAGWDSLFRLVLDFGESSKAHNDWLNTLARKVAEKNAGLVADLYIYFRYRNRQEADMKKLEVYPAPALIQEIRTQWEREPSRIGKTTGVSKIFNLASVVFGLADPDYVSGNTERLDPKTLNVWEWLGPLLVAEATKKDQAVIRQTVGLLFRNQRNPLSRTDDYTVSFDSEVADHLNLDVFSVLKHLDATPHSDPRLENVLSYARQYQLQPDKS